MLCSTQSIKLEVSKISSSFLKTLVIKGCSKKTPRNTQTTEVTQKSKKFSGAWKKDVERRWLISSYLEGVKTKISPYYMLPILTSYNLEKTSKTTT